MSLQDQARTVAALKVIGEILQGQQAQEKAELIAALQELGVKQLEVQLGDAPLASVSVAKGRKTARVANPAEFLQWVVDNHPSEIETVTRVRHAYERAVLDTAKREGVAIDSATAEFIPGVEVGDGDPYLVTKLAEGAHENVLTAIQQGTIMPLALPAGDEAGAA